MGELAALSSAATWAVASLIFARVGRDVTPVVMNALKCGIALGLMMVTLIVLEGTAWPLHLERGALVWLAVSGMVGLTIGDTAYFQALIRIGPRRALLLFSLVPPMTALLGAVVLDEAITATLVVGMGLTLVGVAWVIRERQPDATAADDARLRAGVAFGVLAAVCQAAGNVLTKLGAADASALAVSVVRLTAGGLGLGVQLAVAGRLLEAVRPLGDRVLAPRLIVGTFLGTYLGIWLMNAGLKGADVGVASTLNSTSPIFVLPLAVVLLGERVSLRAVVGAIVAVAGVAVLSLSGVGGG